mmetsp:Transcript_9891/g.14874  ORF Transcript_9891/g.14874 Transcript_9891/m.14874 type:complete len:199 (+) Transcript_9891:92-688(+)
MIKNDLIYLFAFIIYIILCFFRCRYLPCCRNRDDDDEVEYDEGGLSGQNTKAQRLDLIKSRLIAKKAESISDFSSHYRSDLNDRSVEIEGGSSEKIEQSDESFFKTLASSIRSITNTQEPVAVDYRKQCPICIDEYQIGDDICSSPNKKECTHKFHVECMTEWLLKHNNCPLCRADYLKISNDEHTDDNNLGSATGAL